MKAVWWLLGVTCHRSVGNALRKARTRKEKEREGRGKNKQHEEFNVLART